MPSVTSQLSMLALHEGGAGLDMRACNDCGLPYISSLNAHNNTRIQLLQRHISISSVAAVGTLDHRVHLPHSVAAMSASLAASIGAICPSTSVTVCIADRRLVCSYTVLE